MNRPIPTSLSFREKGSKPVSVELKRQKFRVEGVLFEVLNAHSSLDLSRIISSEDLPAPLSVPATKTRARAVVSNMSNPSQGPAGFRHDPTDRRPTPPKQTYEDFPTAHSAITNTAQAENSKFPSPSPGMPDEEDPYANMQKTVDLPKTPAFHLGGPARFLTRASLASSGLERQPTPNELLRPETPPLPPTPWHSSSGSSRVTPSSRREADLAFTPTRGGRYDQRPDVEIRNSLSIIGMGAAAEQQRSGQGPIWRQPVPYEEASTHRLHRASTVGNIVQSYAHEEDGPGPAVVGRRPGVVDVMRFDRSGSRRDVEVSESNEVSSLSAEIDEAIEEQPMAGNTPPLFDTLLSNRPLYPPRVGQPPDVPLPLTPRHRVPVMAAEPPVSEATGYENAQQVLGIPGTDVAGVVTREFAGRTFGNPYSAALHLAGLMSWSERMRYFGGGSDLILQDIDWATYNQVKERFVQERLAEAPEARAHRLTVLSAFEDVEEDDNKRMLNRDSRASSLEDLTIRPSGSTGHREQEGGPPRRGSVEQTLPTLQQLSRNLQEAIRQDVTTDRPEQEEWETVHESGPSQRIPTRSTMAEREAGTSLADLSSKESMSLTGHAPVSPWDPLPERTQMPTHPAEGPGMTKYLVRHDVGSGRPFFVPEFEPDNKIGGKYAAPGPSVARDRIVRAEEALRRREQNLPEPGLPVAPPPALQIARRPLRGLEYQHPTNPFRRTSHPGTEGNGQQIAPQPSSTSGWYPTLTFPSSDVLDEEEGGARFRQARSGLASARRRNPLGTVTTSTGSQSTPLGGEFSNPQPPKLSEVAACKRPVPRNIDSSPPRDFAASTLNPQPPNLSAVAAGKRPVPRNIDSSPPRDFVVSNLNPQPTNKSEAAFSKRSMAYQFDSEMPSEASSYSVDGSYAPSPGSMVRQPTYGDNSKSPKRNSQWLRTSDTFSKFGRRSAYEKLDDDFTPSKSAYKENIAMTSTKPEKKKKVQFIDAHRRGEFFPPPTMGRTQQREVEMIREREEARRLVRGWVLVPVVGLVVVNWVAGQGARYGREIVEMADRWLLWAVLVHVAVFAVLLLVLVVALGRA